MRHKKRKKTKRISPEQATKEYMERIKKIFPEKYFTEREQDRDKNNKDD